MPDTTTTLIEQAVHDAEAGGAEDLGSGADDTQAGSGGEPVETGGESVAVSPSASAAAEPEKPAAEVDAVAKELEELGLKAPVEGERENRLPYSRVKKIVQNAQKKLTDAHTAALTERETKLAAAQRKVDEQERINHLAETDPDRFVQMAAAVNPKVWGPLYKKLTSQAPAADAKPAPTVTTIGPMPAPDAKFEDGSVGYSADGLQKLLDWNRQQARAEAVTETEKRFTERFGPIEQTFRSQQEINQRLPAIRAQLDRAVKTWGKPFEDDYKKDNDSEILGYLRAHPEVTFDAAVATVLIPKIQAERNTMRSEILKEINARPKAAVRTTPAAVTADSNGGPQTTEDMVREAIAMSGRG